VSWLPLLERLTSELRTWGVWKGRPETRGISGDVDSVCAADEWPAALDVFYEWASQNACEPVVACDHFPGLRILAACSGSRPASLLQLDLYAQHVFRGATLVDARRLRPLMIDGPYRRLRPGAEGLLQLILRTRGGGRHPHNVPASPALGLVSDDVEGAKQLASLVGLRPDVVDAVSTGGWSQRAFVSLELRSLRALASPSELRRCVVRDYRRARPCALVAALERGRVVSGDKARWLQEVGLSHVVY